MLENAVGSSGSLQRLRRKKSLRPASEIDVVIKRGPIIARVDGGGCAVALGAQIQFPSPVARGHGLEPSHMACC